MQEEDASVRYSCPFTLVLFGWSPFPTSMTWRAVGLRAEACIGPAGGTRMGTIGRKRSLMLAEEAPDSVRVAESTKEYQA